MAHHLQLRRASAGEGDKGIALNNAAHVFTDLEDDARSVKPSYYFMMRSLLHSRIDTGFLSNQEGDDEDVNVYLAHLLQSFGHTAYLEEAREFLSKYDHEVFERVSRSNDARFKYQVYKTNADFLLMSMGIFGNLSQTLLNQIRGAHPHTRHQELELSEPAILSRGRTYYRFAHNYSQLVFRRNSGVTDVLHKLSKHFDRYVAILSHLRSEYLDLVQELSRGEMFHLERSLSQEQEGMFLREAQDAFLDCFAQWRREPTPEHRAALDHAVVEVRRWDPQFAFDADSHTAH